MTMPDRAQRPLDCLCAADLCVDVILHDNVRPRFNQIEQLIGGYTVELGGSATIFASQFVKLGGAVGILGVVGQDLFGDFVQQRLAGLGMDISRVKVDSSMTTGAGFTLVEPHDRAILTYSGTIDAVDPRELTDGLAAACRHWHIASYFLLNRLRPHWTQWLKRLRSLGVTASLDPNWSPDGRWADVCELLPQIDVFFANENEAIAITGDDDASAAGRSLAMQCPIVVIKRGEHGAAAFHGRKRWDVPPNTPSCVVDTIGAGDCFDAGFIRAWQLGRAIPDCLELATRCGGASLTAAGGFRGQLRESMR